MIIRVKSMVKLTESFLLFLLQGLDLHFEHVLPSTWSSSRPPRLRNCFVLLIILVNKSKSMISLHETIIEKLHHSLADGILYCFRVQRAVLIFPGDFLEVGYSCD